jgi:ankyrin repeat protein
MDMGGPRFQPPPEMGGIAMLIEKMRTALFAVGVLFLSAPAMAVMPDEQFLDLCVQGSAAQVGEALEAGAKPDARDEQGATALMYAVSSNRREVIRLLLDRGADLHARDSFGLTALGHAAQSEPETVSLLLDRGAEVNARSHTGLSPLMLAANSAGANLKVISLLLAAGAEVNAADNDGFTPLIWAAISSGPDTVSMLLSAGADARARERLHGKTAADYAASNKAFQGLQGSIVYPLLQRYAQ